MEKEQAFYDYIIKLLPRKTYLTMEVYRHKIPNVVLPRCYHSP